MKDLGITLGCILIAYTIVLVILRPWQDRFLQKIVILFRKVRGFP